METTNTCSRTFCWRAQITCLLLTPRQNAFFWVRWKIHSFKKSISKVATKWAPRNSAASSSAKSGSLRVCHNLKATSSGITGPAFVEVLELEDTTNAKNKGERPFSFLGTGLGVALKERNYAVPMYFAVKGAGHVSSFCPKNKKQLKLTRRRGFANC